MNTATQFRPFQPGQLLLLPPDMRAWLPEDHLVYFILDVVRELDLSDIFAACNGDKGGQPPFDPRMMVGLLLYGYCVGTVSSRRIEKATHEQVPFRVLTADQHPDHDTISEFRRRHLGALRGLFLQVLRLCRAAGLVRLGHVALDGTKVRANASKHKAMSYGRMDEAERKLVEAEFAPSWRSAEADAAEDALYGKGQRGDELPGVGPREAGCGRSARPRPRWRRGPGRRGGGRRPGEARSENGKPSDGPEAGGAPTRGAPHAPTPCPKAQRNFTDPESRIMKDGATKALCSVQRPGRRGRPAQVIVAAAVTQQANDKQQIGPDGDADDGELRRVADVARRTRELQRGDRERGRPGGDRPARSAGPSEARGDARAGARSRSRPVTKAMAPNSTPRRASRIRPAQDDRGAGVRPDKVRPWPAPVLAARY